MSITAQDISRLGFDPSDYPDIPFCSEKDIVEPVKSKSKVLSHQVGNTEWKIRIPTEANIHTFFKED